MSKKELITDDFIYPFDIDGNFLKSAGYFRDPNQKQPFCRKEFVENTKSNVVNNVLIETKTTTEILVFWIPCKMLLEKKESVLGGKINLEDFGFKVG